MAGFHWLDYVVFSASILISIGVGIYHAIAKGGQNTTDKYLLGDRKMHFLPVTISLAVTSLSAVTIQGVPGEMYMFGLKFVFYCCGVMLAAVICTYTFIPLYYPLQITSVNEYLELRFQSKSVRLMGCTILILMQCCYVGCLMFGPAIALQIATGLNPFYTLLIVNTAGILYTTIGGLKAVVYTDLFQFTIMLSGVIIVATVGTINSGGVNAVLDENHDWGRLDFHGFLSPDPTARVTLWSCVIGGCFMFLAMYGVNQASTQRYLAMPKIEDAKRALLITGLIFIMMHVISCVVGISMFGYYSQTGCDPLQSGELSNPNQLLPEFVITVLNYPAIPGLFISCLVSSSLSSLSSSVNAMSAVLWEDLLKLKFNHLSSSGKAMFTRVLSLIFGLICTGISFAVWSIGGNLSQIAIAMIGALIGPLLGVHILGAVLPWSNWIGALVGGIGSFITAFWILLGQILSKRANLPLPSPTSTCDSISNSTTVSYRGAYLTGVTTAGYDNMPTTETLYTDLDEDSGSPILQYVYMISFHWYPMIFSMLAVIIGITVSICTGVTNPKHVDSRFLFPFLRKNRNLSSRGPEVIYSNEFHEHGRKPV